MTERYEKSPADQPGFLNGAQSIPTWCSLAIQIRTYFFLCQSGLEVIEGDGLGAFLVVEGEHHLVVIQENGVDEGVNEHFPVGLLPYIQFAESLQPEGDELGTDPGLGQLLTGDPGFQVLLVGFQFFQTAFRGLG